MKVPSQTCDWVLQWVASWTETYKLVSKTALMEGVPTPIQDCTAEVKTKPADR